MTEQQPSTPPPLQQPRWALITNTTPGSLAEALALTCRTRGINVIATSPSASKAVEHISPTIGTLEGFLIRIHLDPTSSKSIRHGVELVQQLTSGRLSLLINCCASGMGSCHGPLLDVDLAQAKREYDMVVWSPLAITQAFFPLLRAGKGMVVNQTSVSGIGGYSRPFQGVYGSGMAAVSSLNDIMRVEFEPFGVNVVGLVLGAIKDDSVEKAQNGKWNDRSPYVLIKDEVEQAVITAGENRRDRFEIAEKVVEVLVQEKPPPFVRLGYLATLMWLMHWLLPVWLLDTWHRKGSGLGKLQVMLNVERGENKEQ